MFDGRVDAGYLCAQGSVLLNGKKLPRSEGTVTPFLSCKPKLVVPGAPAPGGRHSSF